MNDLLTPSSPSALLARVFRPSAWILATICAFCFGNIATPANAAPPSQEAQANQSLRNELEAAIQKGTQWLHHQQKTSGAFSEERNPALTALSLIAILRSGLADTSEFQQSIETGFSFLRSLAKKDGGIYAEGLSNYNTALCLLAFLQKRRESDSALIHGARDFLVRQQAQEMVRPELNGGIGYGPTGVSPKRMHPDLDNTMISLEALRAFELSEKTRETPANAPGLDWKAVVSFVSRCQNLAQTNPEPWVARSPAERGGFVYYPGFSNAGEVAEEGGRKALRSSGSMSYAGLLSFIYAEIPKEDPRIDAALGWLKGNFTLEENPGLGKQGLFYYYHLMAKALVASGVETLQTAGKTHHWARELGIELINRQESGGFWVNDTGRWMEKDQVLVTAYSLLTLELLRSSL